HRSGTRRNPPCRVRGRWVSARQAEQHSSAACGASTHPTELLVRTLRQLLLLDGEDRAGLDLHVAYDALAAAHVRELDVVTAGLEAGDAQALVVIDLAVTVVLALVGAPFVLAGRR